jgi:hypothetical protein
MKLNKFSIGFFLFIFTFSCENGGEKQAIETPTANQIEDGTLSNDKEESSIEVEKTIETNSKGGDLSLFSGQAEIATYTLDKARYEGNHSGEAVLIFVTEPFLTKKQVKADHPTPENSVKVLKLNRVDRFNTGIYDYSQFTSVFTPADIDKAKYPLKITMGSQDWCGQSYTQINNKSGYAYEHRSYFESEGDTSFQIEYAYSGDNMMNLIRMSPDLLPLGDFSILPSMHYLRTSHADIKNYYANGSITETDDGYIYVYDIPELKRSVRFFISSKNQFQITKWEESYPTVFDGQLRTSTYELKGVKYLSYWKFNGAEDADLRKDLKLNY